MAQLVNPAAPVVDKLSRFFNLSADIFVITDLLGHAFQINGAFAKVLGHDAEKWLGRPLLKLLHPQERQGTKMLVKQYLRVGRTTFTLQNRFHCDSGTYKWLEWNAVAVPEEGQLFLVGRDISERFVLERELNQSTRQITAILENLPVALYSLDREWRFTYLNNRALSMAKGKEIKELIGSSIWDQYPETVGTTSYFMYHKAMELMEPQHFETSSLLYPDRFFEFRVYPSEEGLLVFCQDITSIQQMKRELEYQDRISLIGQMAAGIAHEVRNPMTAIRGYLQLLQHKAPQFQDYLSLMISELDRANVLISEYLSLAKNKPTEPKPQDLNALLHNLQPLLEAEALNNSKYIVMETAPVPMLELDCNEIRQLVLNLGRNGLDAMDAGGRLTIRSSLADGLVVLEVADQGPGIDPEVASKLGTPFFTTKEQGTGLGLTICYSIAARHRATVNFLTGPTGTTFYVRFIPPNA